MSEQTIELDNKTITKLAIAIATAKRLTEDGEAIGPLVREVLGQLDQIDRLDHFIHHGSSQ